MIKIDKRQIVFGVFLDVGEYEVEELIEKIAKKNGWNKEKARQVVEQIFGQEKEVGIQETKQEKKKTNSRGKK